MIGDVMQLSFNDMGIEDIEKEYGRVERVVTYEQAIINESKGNQIPENVFDLKNENRAYKNVVLAKL